MFSVSTLNELEPNFIMLIFSFGLDEEAESFILDIDFKLGVKDFIFN